MQQHVPGDADNSANTLSSELSEHGKYPNPVRAIVITALVIFTAELITMVVINSMHGIHPVAEMLIDSVLLVVLVLPFLYKFLYLPMLENIQQRRIAEEEIARRIMYDELTGLPNRTLLIEQIKSWISICSRDQSSFALVVLNINRLKEINDTLSYNHGNTVIQQLALRLREGLRSSDIVSRIGGDEFVIIMPKMGMNLSLLAVEKITAITNKTFLIDESPLEMECSVGVVVYPDHGNDPLSLLQKGDVAMRLAKKEPSGFAIYDENNDPYSSRRVLLFGDLRRAIQGRELFLVYQPKVNIQTQEVIGVEALIRWMHPKDGLIPPNDFIPLAESTTLITPLTNWVLENAITQCTRWMESGIDLRISVNISTRNLVEKGFVERVAKLIRDARISPEKLIFEVTESAIMSNQNRALATLTRLNHMGVGLSVDDFGTGYSSLSYLKNLPLHELKIDQSFIKGLTSNENDEQIVKSTVTLAHNLNLKVTAEGVEDQNTLEALAKLDCDVAQGYFLSKPLPIHEVDPWLMAFTQRARQSA